MPRHVCGMRMMAYVEERWSPAAPWARRAAVLAFAVLVVGMAAHWSRMLDTPSFLWTLALVAALALLALALVVIGFPKIWYRGFRGGSDIVVATIVAGIILVPIGLAIWWAMSHPPLTDISTDLDDPPQFAEALKDRTGEMNPVLVASDEWRAQQLEAYPEVTGRSYAAPIENVRAAVERTFDSYGWTPLGPYIVGEGTEFELETTVYSSILALPSDVIVRLIEEGETTFVDMRSTSRYGSTDFGENAERIQLFLKDLDIAVTAATPAAPKPSE